MVTHPALIDEELRKCSAYIDAGVKERDVLMNQVFREALRESGVVLGGCRDICVQGNAHSIAASGRGAT